jgi:hypothetical protein
MGIFSSTAIVTVLSSVAIIFSNWLLCCELRDIAKKLERIWDKLK